MSKEEQTYVKSSIHFKKDELTLREKVLLLCRERRLSFNTAVIQALKDWVNK